MQVPLEIAFHNIDSSEWVEREIRACVDDLERIYGRLTSCRVRVDQRAKNRTGSIPPVVRIELGIPGRPDLAVTHEPEHLQRKFQTPDIRNAIHEAFRIAERRLREVKERREDRSQQPPAEADREFLGQVAELYPERDFGFLINNGGSLLYFHRSSMLTGDFDRLKRGDEVHYVEEVGDTGPIATKVRAKNKR
ncbi:MAG TPA: HPF/RaiA family ribosome-associated protein [Xanthobacteraceae bacterium]|jgi:cold shock CspA family protein/ribosome-associated translation inhibitor RaiA